MIEPSDIHRAMDFLVTNFDGFSLAFPASDVDAVVCTADMKRSIQSGLSSGDVPSNGREYKVFQFDHHLNISVSEENPTRKNRPFCVCLSPVYSSEFIAIAVETVEKLSLHQGENLHELLPTMRKKYSPLSGVIDTANNHLTFLSNSTKISIYISNFNVIQGEFSRIQKEAGCG